MFKYLHLTEYSNIFEIEEKLKKCSEFSEMNIFKDLTFLLL